MRNLFLSLVFLTLAGCVSTNKIHESSVRQPQASPAVEMDDSIQVTFRGLMSSASDAERSRAFAKFLDRQRDFYFISQGMLSEFDAELDRIYNIDKVTPLSAKDFEKFDQLSFQMRIAWEFSERNLHEIIGLYELALIQANDRGAEFHKASDWIIVNISDWLKDGVKKGHTLAIMNLSQHLDEINSKIKGELQKNNQKVIRIPIFEKYYKLSAERLMSAQAQSLRISKDRKQTLLDSFTGKKWLEYKVERSIEIPNEVKTWRDQSRTPQVLDNNYPDAGGAGHVTGNRFPANTWAITLDDGPHPTHTEGMFKVLRDAGMSGTFFWQTKNLLAFPHMSKRAKDLSMNRASHSYNHANLPKLGPAALKHEIVDAFDDFEKVVGQQPTLFRCPYGACGPMGSNIRKMIAGKNALHIAWNVDTVDWQDKNAQSIFERTRKQIDVQKRGIILLHDIHPQSVEALKLITSYLANRNYAVKALPEIIGIVREKSYDSP